MKPIKSSLAILSLFLISFHFVLPSPELLAMNEETVSAGEYGYTPVKTLEQAQAAPLEHTSTATANPNDFFNENPLSLSEETSVSEELKAEAEVFLAGLESFEDLSDDVNQAGKKPSNNTSSWGLTAVNAQQAWALTRGSGITIAVIDTGLDFKHEDIKNNFYTNTAEANGLPGVDDDGNGFVDDIRGWDFVNNDNNPTDDNGHGSHVAGIAAADSTNSKGIAGVAPDAKVLAVKVLDASGNGAIENVIKGIKYAADLGAQVINMSLGILKKYLTNPLLTAFQDAINYAVNKGSVVITAAGNEGVDSNTTAPAGLNNTIAVGAVDISNKRPSWSNKNPDIMAPGVDILSLKFNGGYTSLSGTSMASPFVAGAAALIRAYLNTAYAGFTGQQIYNDVYTRLIESAFSLSKKNYDTNFGYGLLDAFKALTVSTSASFTSFGSSLTEFSNAETSSSLQAAGFQTGPAVFAPAISRSGNWYRIGALESQAAKKRRLSPARKPLTV